MFRWTKRIAIALTCLLALFVYREWIVRHHPPLFLPLGFFEAVHQGGAPEEVTRDSRNWQDPIASNVLDPQAFDRLASGTETVSVDLFVNGATLSGMAAAISAAEDGATVTLTSPIDWHTTIASSVALYAATAPGNVPHSSLERMLYPPASTTSPGDAVTLLESRIAALPSLTILSPSTIVALGADADGHLTRALVQASDGSRRTVVTFTYAVDGTNDGSLLALAGIPTRTSWDDAETTGETVAPPRAAVMAAAEGYTMSGHTILGIGKRLDGAQVAMGIVDRGYHGRFVGPTNTDPCWEPDIGIAVPTSFIAGQTILRTRTIGCAAHMMIESSAEDTVELFFINHGNDAHSFSIALGSESTLSVESHNDASKRFVRIGAFPVGPHAPIDVRLTSILPTDRLEGIVVRPMNTGHVGMHTTINAGENTDFTVNGWNMTMHDIYIHTVSDEGTLPLSIDNLPYVAERIGTDTFLVRNLPLARGKHTVHTDAQATLDAILIAPYTPFIEIQPSGEQRWSFTATHNGNVVLYQPKDACRSVCTYTMTKKGTTNVLFQERYEADNLLMPRRPVGTAEVHAETTYEISAEGAYVPEHPPVVSYLDNSSSLYILGTDDMRLTSPENGQLYDLWIRSFYASTATVTVGTTTYRPTGTNTWTYVGTEILPTAGVHVESTGGMELLALPNTNIGTYRLPIPSSSQSITMRGIQNGTYDIITYGADVPNAITMMNDGDHSSHEISLDGNDDSHNSTTSVDLSGTSTSFSWNGTPPEEIILREPTTIHSGNFSLSDAVLVPLSLFSDQAPGPESIGHSTNSSGTFLLFPDATGIGPVTIGTLGTPSLESYIRNVTHDAYVLLRYGHTTLTNYLNNCTYSEDPTCDSRRYVRTSLQVGAQDLIPTAILYPDARRLIGKDTLTSSGSFAHLRTCQSCQTECVPGSLKKGVCVLSDTFPATKGALVSISGISVPVNMASPSEKSTYTIPSLFTSLRQDGFLGKSPTYLEQQEPARDITLTIGMVVPASGYNNIIVAGTHISATHAASRALRSSTSELAVGSAVGHALGFALKQEHSSLEFIMQSHDAFTRLQQYLIKKGVTVFPASGVENDPLLMQVTEQRVLDGRASLVPHWIEDRLELQPSAPTQQELLTIRTTSFPGARTMQDLLSVLPGSPAEKTPAALLPFGLSTGLISQKMLGLSLNEVMHIPVDDELLLKAEYLQIPPPTP